MSDILELSNFSVSYGSIRALNEISLKVPAQTIVTIVGPNGAGKSTCLNAIIGLIESEGGLWYDGAPARRLRAEDKVRAGLCLVSEQRELFAQMSVVDNLILGSVTKKFSSAQRAAALDEVYALFPRLLERRHQLAGTLSGGERQMLALGRALMSRPKLLMLDEPSLGLAPLIVKEMFSAISALRSSGIAILLVEQNVRQALLIADYGYVLENGSIVQGAPCAELRQNSRIIESYLGQGVKD